MVVILKPPYQFDAATPGETIAFSHFFGQHGYPPDLVDLENNINMRSVFVASGPSIVAEAVIENVEMIDVAPTIAFALGIDSPANAEGAILRDIFVDERGEPVECPVGEEE